MSARIVLYGRPGCHLCDEAEARVRQLAPYEAIELVNIEQDEDLHRRFLERIPVVEVDGSEIAELVQYRRAQFAEKLVTALA